MLITFLHTGVYLDVKKENGSLGLPLIEVQYRSTLGQPSFQFVLGGNIERSEMRSPATKCQDQPIDHSVIYILLFKGLLKNAFIPALRHNCFVESWQSALNATTENSL
jgi:hypothetical protein